MKVTAIQHNSSKNIEDNLALLAKEISKAASEGSSLVVLQELHNTPYFCCELDDAHFNLAETIPGPSTDFFSKLAKHHNIVIVCSLFERRRVGVYHNTAVVIDLDGSIAGCYRKMHIPHDPGFEEKYYFTPGDINDDGFKPIQTQIGNLGVLVCWDQWFPEAARIMALNGADILIYPTAIGWDPTDSNEEKQRQLDAWLTIQRSHAIANGLAIVCCNRVGFEKGKKMKTAGTEFWGHSFIADTMGKVLCSADHKTTMTISTEINLGETQTTRQTWPFMRDRRINAYKNILKR